MFNAVNMGMMSDSKNSRFSTYSQLDFPGIADKAGKEEHRQ